jgi:hypothetical protein
MDSPPDSDRPSGGADAPKPPTPAPSGARSFRLGPPIKTSAGLERRTRRLETYLEAQRSNYARHLRRRIWRRPRGLLWFSGVVLLTIVVLLAVYEDYIWIVALIAAALFLNAIVLALASATRRFVWLGVAIFLSVPMFGALVALVRTDRSPKVQPVALIRKGDNVGLCGIYITETDKRVYLGRVEPKDERHAIDATGRIFWVPDDQVDMIKIGPLESIRQANTRAPRLLEELYRDRAEDPGVGLKATTETTNDGKTATVAEKAPHPVPQSTRKPVPKTIANACTDVSLDKALPSTRADPKPTDHTRPPFDDSPRDP